MGCKYVVMFELENSTDIRNCEKAIKNAIAILLPSKIKKDEQAKRHFKKMEIVLRKRAKDITQIRMVKIVV